MRSRREGFTLIELLVVIAIIAILAAILFPVFGRARDAGTQASCKSNLMQIGKAFSMYMDDYYCSLPPSCSGSATWSTVKPAGWMGKAYRYTKKAEVFKCPGRPRVNFAYSMNEAVSLMDGVPPRPSRVLLVGEAPGSGPFYADNDPAKPADIDNRFTGDCDISTGGDKGQNDGWTCDSGKLQPRESIDLHANNFVNSKRFNFDPKAKSGNWNDSHYIFFPGAHNGSTNILFMDGHVGSYKDWNKDQMTFGWMYTGGKKTPRPSLVTYP